MGDDDQIKAGANNENQSSSENLMDIDNESLTSLTVTKTNDTLKERSLKEKNIVEMLMVSL